MKIWDDTGEALARLLDATALRQRVVAANLANVNTPGYRSRDVRFEEMLQELLRDGRPLRAASDLPAPEIFERKDVRPRENGNTVDLEREMGEMTRNALLYQAYTRFLDHKIATLRVAITGR